MVADKNKYFNKIKIFVILIWLVYLIIYNSKFRVHLPLHFDYADYNDYSIKKEITLRKGIALIGGSNVRSGLSAEIIGDNFYNCYNFGVSSESIKFSEYIDFIGDRISSDIVVYSTKYIWYDSPTDKTYFFNYFYYVPSYSIISQITEFISPVSSNLNSSKSSYFNSFGDQVGYECDTVIQSDNISEDIFIRNNIVIVEDIINRIKILKKITGTDKVLIRIPPIYVNEDRKKLISKMIDLRIKALKKAEIMIIGETVVSSDKSLFCDNFHPNEKGRTVFSNEIKFSLKKINLDINNSNSGR